MGDWRALGDSPWRRRQNGPLDRQRRQREMEQAMASVLHESLVEAQDELKRQPPAKPAHPHCPFVPGARDPKCSVCQEGS